MTNATVLLKDSCDTLAKSSFLNQKIVYLMVFAVGLLATGSAFTRSISGIPRPSEASILQEWNEEGHAIKVSDKVQLANISSVGETPKLFVFTEVNKNRCQNTRCGTDVTQRYFHVVEVQPTKCHSTLIYAEAVENSDTSQTEPLQLEILDHRERICDDYIQAAWEIKLIGDKSERYFTGYPKQYTSEIIIQGY